MHPTLHVQTSSRRRLADTLTPVAAYLRLRDLYAQPLLLESSDYHSREGSYSFVCLEPIARFTVQGETVQQEYFGQAPQTTPLPADVPAALQAFMHSIDSDAQGEARRFNGFFGHTSYDAVRHFEQLTLDPGKPNDGIPDLRYGFYRYLLVFHHFKDTLYLIENLPQGEESGLDRLEQRLQGRGLGSHAFRTVGEEVAAGTEAEYMDTVRKAVAACQAGEIFQGVFSRRFSQGFEGDEFNVYRALRAINPSPYLFYFDYTDYRLFGSSPEAQLAVSGGKAQIHPIAGTYRRTGDDAEDAAAAQRLSQDPKENAEHVMLVDLARNDLSRSTRQVQVTRLKEVQYFSHVIHLTSVVEGSVPPGTNPVRLLADSFPAGTLSGAPKHRAMTLIDRFEPVARGYYGGAIGMFGLDGDVNHAILIRSFLSRAGRLHYQAGAGVVVDSQPESELAEVANKLAALRKALQIAQEL